MSIDTTWQGRNHRPADPRDPTIAVGRPAYRSGRRDGRRRDGLERARGPPGSGQKAQQSIGAEPKGMADLLACAAGRHSDLRANFHLSTLTTTNPAVYQRAKSLFAPSRLATYP